MEKIELKIREILDTDKKWVKTLLIERWGSPQIITKGKVYNALDLPGFIAFHGEKPVGLAIYRIEGNECELITLDSVEQGRGIGTQLLNSVIEKSRKENCNRLWLITTNDNMKAQKFYKKRGFMIVAVYKNAIIESRKLKPQIPLMGENGIPIKDEIEMELQQNAT